MKKAKALFFLFDRPIFFSFYKQAPPGRPVPGRLSVLETEIRRQLKELLESLTNKRKKKMLSIYSIFNSLLLLLVKVVYLLTSQVGRYSMKKTDFRKVVQVAQLVRAKD